MEQLSKILDVIHSQAQAEADEIMQKSTQRIVEIQHTFAGEARLGEQAILNTAHRQAEEILRRSDAEASMQSRNLQLQVKREILDRAFEKALGKLSQKGSEARKELYEKLIEKVSLGDKVTVQLNEEDRRKLGKKLKVKGVDIDIDKSAGDFCGGLIIKEEFTETDCTFEALVFGMQKELEPAAADMLFRE